MRFRPYKVKPNRGPAKGAAKGMVALILPSESAEASSRGVTFLDGVSTNSADRPRHTRASFFAMPGYDEGPGWRNGIRSGLKLRGRKA